MRDFCYKKRYKALLKPEIVIMQTQIHELKGSQKDFVSGNKDLLTRLAETAKIQSTEASNKIEGICTSNVRLKQLVLDKTLPENQSEKEIAGYRNALGTINENFAYIPPKPAMLLQLHRELYRFSGSSAGGCYKSADNFTEKDAGENKITGFCPVPASETSAAIESLCAAFEEAADDPEIDPLLLIPMFVLDFLCIHPFNDGNGRMSRLLTLLLLYRAGYTVGKYISIEKMIESGRDAYYETLRECFLNRHEGENTDGPFVKYMLGIIRAAYIEFENRVKAAQKNGLSKPERIRKVIQDTPGKITKSQVMEKCPDISQVTVQRTLNELVKSGDIIKIGGGRYTAYAWNREKES